jgi:hypothetical protein
MKNSNKNNWKQLEDEIMQPISDKATSLFELFSPERKERKESGRKPSSEDESAEYTDELYKKRKARYEALKEKYKD